MTMFSNKFVLSVLADGQVQKELRNGEVHLKFGQQYSVRLRNKNDRTAVVKLHIDGDKVCRGGFVVPANSYRDIECSSQTLRRFKFVDLQSTEAQDHGKDQVNADKLMGVVEAHFHLEKERPKVQEVHHHHHHPYPVPRPWPVYPYRRICDHQMFGTYAGRPVTGGLAGDNKCSVGTNSLEACRPAADCEVDFCGSEAVQSRTTKGVVSDGATVEGDFSNQRFGEMNIDYEEASTVLKLYLRGYQANDEAAVVEVSDGGVQPVPDTDARYCDKCGSKAAKKGSNFCHKCGNRIA